MNHSSQLHLAPVSPAQHPPHLRTESFAPLPCLFTPTSHPASPCSPHPHLSASSQVGIWHPAAPGMYEDLKEYLNWYDTRKDLKFAADAPVIGLVLQRSHLVTGDEGHYAGVVMELEARGAKVCVWGGGGLWRRPGGGGCCTGLA